MVAMELKTYFLPLLKWWWLLLLASLLAAGTSYWVVRQQPAQYQSKTTLIIGQTLEALNPSGNELYLGVQLAGWYADVGKRAPVREATMEALGMNWLPAYNVVALPNRQLLEITVLDTDPLRAQVVASELANQLIRLSPGSTEEGERDRQAFIRGQLDTLEEQISATEEEILIKQEELGELFSAREIASTESEIASLQSKLRTLQSTYAGLLAGTKEEAVNILRILEPATFSARPVGSGKMMTVLTATAPAFALAAAAAYLLEYLDDTIKTPKQISKQFGLQVVGTIARLRSAQGSGLVMLEAPRSPEAEGFRGLRTAIQFVLDSSNAKSVLVTSPHQSEGKSLIAANLALAMAQAGQRTLLIDADLHRPTQHKLFAVDNTHGLSSVLLQRELLEQVEPEELPVPEFLTNNFITRGTNQKYLSVMTSGPIAPNASELFMRGAVRRLLELVAAEYEVIILDTPPVLALSDAASLSSQVDFVFLLARAERTRKTDMQNAVAHLASVGATMGGIILNQLSSSSEHYYYSYYRSSNVAGEDSSVEIGDPATTSRKNGFMARPREGLRRFREISGKSINS
jgi:polysaccharide biosynthesis transport protein